MICSRGQPKTPMKTKVIKKYGREILPGEKIHIGEGKFVEVRKFNCCGCPIRNVTV